MVILIWIRWNYCLLCFRHKLQLVLLFRLHRLWCWYLLYMYMLRLLHVILSFIIRLFRVSVSVSVGVGDSTSILIACLLFWRVHDNNLIISLIPTAGILVVFLVNIPWLFIRHGFIHQLHSSWGMVVILVILVVLAWAHSLGLILMWVRGIRSIL